MNLLMRKKTLLPKHTPMKQVTLMLPTIITVMFTITTIITIMSILLGFVGSMLLIQDLPIITGITQIITGTLMIHITGE